MSDHVPPTRLAASRRARWMLARWTLVPTVLLGLFWITGCMERMFYIPTAGPTPASEGPPGTQSVWFESQDGTRLHGWFIPGRGGAYASPDDHGRAPAILHVHGNAGNIALHTYFTEHLPPAGFSVLIFDYRGYGQSGGVARKRDDLIADTHAALDALLARPDVDPRRIGIYGQSLGGAIAINVMAARPDIRAGVFESAFTSWRDMAAAAIAGDPPPSVARWVASMLIPDHARPDEAIRNIDRPMLLLHGDADTIVPASHARRLAEAAGESARLVMLDGGDHNSLRTTHAHIDRLTVEFFRAHLGSPERSADLK
jgi:uncharacterized protein